MSAQRFRQMAGISNTDQTKMDGLDRRSAVGTFDAEGYCRQIASWGNGIADFSRYLGVISGAAFFAGVQCPMWYSRWSGAR
jgi:hypothetical protein